MVPLSPATISEPTTFSPPPKCGRVPTVSLWVWALLGHVYGDSPHIPWQLQWKQHLVPGAGRKFGGWGDAVYHPQVPAHNAWLRPPAWWRWYCKLRWEHGELSDSRSPITARLAPQLLSLKQAQLIESLDCTQKSLVLPTRSTANPKPTLVITAKTKGLSLSSQSEPSDKRDLAPLHRKSPDPSESASNSHPSQPGRLEASPGSFVYLDLAYLLQEAVSAWWGRNSFRGCKCYATWAAASTAQGRRHVWLPGDFDPTFTQWPCKMGWGDICLEPGAGH